MNVFTGLVGAVVEAWSELRVHRTRVLLSLIGVAVAVAAITGVVAIGGIIEQSQTESSERYGGRPALLAVQVADEDNRTPDASSLDAAYARLATRYDIGYSSRVLQSQISVRTPEGSVDASALGIDPSYATMHRLRTISGRMPSAGDASRLAPAVVIDSSTWKMIGSPALDTHPTVSLLGDRTVTAVVVGVQRSECDQCYSITMLYDQFLTSASARDLQNAGTPTWEVWVPPAQAKPLTARMTSDLTAQFGSGWNVNVSRNDYAATQYGDPLLPLKLGVGGIGGLVLLLGALGLLNISLVTVRYRIREIGIRRSFGATAGRVFFSVMMESLVATVAAGFIGVIVAVIALQNPISASFVGKVVQDVPAFPVSAALLGLGVSTAVGALAGLLPAIVAVRVKPIDAIRY